MVLDKQRRTFLSYSRTNKDFALKLARELKAEGFSVWLDQLDIPAGARWDREVEKALKESEIFMIILTPASTNSENVLDEIGYAIDTGKRILPVLLENCEIPLRLRRFQYVDFTAKRFDDGVQSAKELLEHLIAQLPPRGEELANVSLGQTAATAGKLPEIEGAPKRSAVTETVHKQLPLQGRLSMILVIAAVMIVIVGLAYNLLPNRGENNLSVPTSPPETAAILPPTMDIPASVATTASTSVPDSTVTPASISAPTLGIPKVSEEDGMTLLYVPAGEFIMGSNTGRPNEAPAHTVMLDAFWIDQTEVTIAMYRKCVQAGVCKPPINKPSNYYYRDAQYDNYPVIFVYWSMADSYCTWAARRLPTEAEWEKAASWDDQAKTKRTYPWGDEEPSALYLNYNQSKTSAVPVGTYPEGESPYGALDMAGNVYEWVADFYGEQYYTQSPPSNPPGPAQDSYRIIRGGSYLSGATTVKTTYRFPEEPTEDPDHAYPAVGFRCAQTP